MADLASLPARLVRALDDLRAHLERRFGPGLVELRLFGSRARDDSRADSDVDVLVVLDAAGWARRCAVINGAADVGLEHDLLISPTVFDLPTWTRWCEQGRPLAREIERDGIRL